MDSCFICAVFDWEFFFVNLVRSFLIADSNASITLFDCSRALSPYLAGFALMISERNNLHLNNVSVEVQTCEVITWGIYEFIKNF